jgi:hypothetical protein
MHQGKQFRQRSLISIAPLAEQLGHRLSRGSRRRHRGSSPPQIVSQSTNFYSTAGGNQKKPALSWRVSGGLLAYAHEPAQTTNTPGKQNRKQTLERKNQCKLKTQ